MSERRTIWLVGMMGAGKSSVGPELARRLACAYVDTDAEIERESGHSIGELFDGEGEAGFRARERAAIEARAGERVVVALGGGAIAQAGARELLAGSGTIVYLRARSETLAARLGACADRPLLRSLDPDQRAARIAELLAERRGAYEAADIVLDVDDQNVDQVVERIVRELAGELDR